MRWAVTPLLFLLLAFPAAADDEPAKKAKPLTPEQAADAVLEAVKAKDEAALKALAEKDKPDPWPVADELCYRGEHDAAEAFAKAAPRKAVEKLPAYVAQRRDKESDSKLREVLAALKAAVGRRDWEGALASVQGVATTPVSVTTIRIAYDRALALSALRRHAESGREYGVAAEGARSLGWLTRAASAYFHGGVRAHRNADFRGALSAWQMQLQMAEALRDKRGVARTLANIGTVQSDLRQNAAALATLHRSLKMVEELGDEGGIASALKMLGFVQERAGQYTEALSSFHRSLEIAKAIGDNQGVASVLGQIGFLQESLFMYAEAISTYGTALEMFEALDHERGVMITLCNLGNAQTHLGKFAEALATFHRSLELARALGDKRGISISLGNIGGIQKDLGQYADALESHRQSLEISEAIGDKLAAAVSLRNIGNVYRHVGKYVEALACFRRSLATAEAVGDRQEVGRALGSLGLVLTSLGQHAEALSSHRRSLEVKETLGDKRGAAVTLGNIGVVRMHMGEYAAAMDAYGRALAALETTPAPRERARIIWDMARIRLAQEMWDESIALAREAVASVERLSRGLSEHQGATSGDLWTGVYSVGLHASIRAGKNEEAAFFLESGRAGSLRVALGARETLRSVVIPEGLRREESLARVSETRAMNALRAASRQSSLAETRAARKTYDAARKRMQDLVGRIQREAKRGASIAYPKADDLATMQTRLDPTEALVLYGLSDVEGEALVIRRTGSQVVTLANSARLIEAAEALDALDSSRSPTAAVAELRRLLIDPLELKEDVERVLVSPAGRLSYLPFVLLMPRKEVAYVPSGTTYGLLLAAGEERGTKIFALGSPDYRTVVHEQALAVNRSSAPTGLSSLPATREEVEAIADTVLIGKEATETRLREALTKQARWRAVHFACHGLVDPDQPLLSSLAITADAENDGFLTCLNVFRMKIPADLVVLSACETGKGRIYRSEGIVGLTRAFMFAGAPRVICSLWKVDDEATQALMIKFYELWNPKDGKKGLGAAAALKKAQEYIRNHSDHPQWKHPYYWAAWVLWGLPD